ncbi:MULTISPECIES: DUF3152 domain-containing protein [unclassified Nocardioides]|uniref:DUF3152 domain-containing protein n=1 Tax=unclassified Nocardioides TaxID=2615069 RepID=UPI0009F04C3C|nr:uncharacterized protein PD653B2_2064 [Nocardioides sp. PD653-B2]GAW56523.1 uncharacterized protein PD653_3960 [Nocardioides sp. PD653]
MPYAGATAFGKDPQTYRRYLVNHDFGHAHGNSHEACPAEGQRAPVMMRQTKCVETCVPNPWPYPPRETSTPVGPSRQLCS